MKNLRVAVVGCGFWSRFQVPAWQELSDVDCVAVCDLDEDQAKQTASAFGIKNFYAEAAKMIQEQRPDVLDVITSALSLTVVKRLRGRMSRIRADQNVMAAIRSSDLMH
jgi:predicted dehydrogenase